MSRRGISIGVVALGLLVSASGAAMAGRPATGREDVVATAEATIETTKGTIVAELYGQEAPKTVANFTKLARQGFYNGIIFHRVIPGFMIQTGDPTGTGSGGPGYTFADEISPTLKHDQPGILSMANAGPNTNGSQFFITVAATPWLNGKHAIFGRVIKGQEVADAIANAPRGAQDRPTTTIKMTSVTVKDLP